ncbi:MAG TPA: hypothetical protein VHU41_10620 [Thermoanaerobaculia bacterium]|jgi:predicted DNA binding protein|nr:hypothetical protein [Thermoanaerobaculia bacterium]
MKVVTAVFGLLLAFPASQVIADPGNSFDQAEALSTGRDLAKARDLYHDAAIHDPDPKRRDEAAIAAATLDWYVFHDTAAAKEEFARVSDSSAEASRAWSERASMELELTRDFSEARADAARASALAQTLADRERAALRSAAAAIEPVRQAHLDQKCSGNETVLREAEAILDSAIRDGGPTIDSARLLLDAALLSRDDATALKALKWYYAAVPALVPSSVSDRRRFGLALAHARLYAEAELVLANPCEPALTADNAIQDVLAYSAALRRITARVAEHHRAIARGADDTPEFKKELMAESSRLWNSLSWPSGQPELSEPRFEEEMRRRFGAVITLGETDGIFSALYGHSVIDETRPVEQYGRRASLRYVSLDGMVSGGYATWATRGRSGTGGWIGSEAIYEIRPMYADDAIHTWRRIMDRGLRTRDDEEIAAETLRDVQRARTDPIQYFPGLARRLKRQAGEKTLQRLTRRGLRGEPLRDAFLVSASQNVFNYSIWAHEGRHAIDKKIFQIADSVELEFLAKLSQVTFAAIPRGALGSILSPVGPPSAHGIANAMILRLLDDWMRIHRAEIAQFDEHQPPLIQLDKLTDAQLRAAMRSFDPLAAAR